MRKERRDWSASVPGEEEPRDVPRIHVRVDKPGYTVAGPERFKIPSIRFGRIDLVATDSQHFAIESEDRDVY
jgi:hypothetical protein